METAPSSAPSSAPSPAPSSAQSSARTAIDIFRTRVTRTPGLIATRYKEGGTWLTLSWSDWNRISREVAGGLRALGVATGDRVCLLSSSRHEWGEADVGILMAGAATVPIYQSNLAAECAYIIVDSGAKVVLAEDPAQLEKLLRPEIRTQLGNVVKVVLFSDLARLEKPDAQGRKEIRLDDVLPAGSPEREWVLSWSAFCASGRAWDAANPGALDAIAAEITPTQLFTIVYTSGTTGPPKGVVLTHDSIAYECNTLLEGKVLEIDSSDEQLLFLPLAHIFAKILLWTAIATGARTAYAEGIPQLMDNMKEVQPTYMGSVPRVYEKAYAKIKGNLEAKRRGGGIAGKLVGWALGVGKRASETRQRGQEPSGLLAIEAKLANKLVFAKVQAAFGGKLRFFVSGGAPLAREIAEFFHAAGILILEGYGLTETAAATHINRPSRFRFGTVGPAIPGTEVKIAADGEILVRGRNVMREYYGKPEATAEAIDADKWFHTGDIGVIEDGLLRITDRKKDIIVTAGGKNVAPQNIEGAFKSQCQYVSQMMVHGDKRQFLSALLTLNEEAVLAWAQSRGLAGDVAALSQHADVRALLQGAIDQLNAGLASYETVKKFTILPRDFSQDAGEMTPTLKVKRKFCSEKYMALLDAMYA